MKNDPVIRMLLIVILGTIAFALLFNLFSGGGNEMNDMLTSNMSNGTSVNAFLASLLVLLVKFLMIILVLAVVIGVVMWIKNNFFKDTNINLEQTINKDPMLKMVVGISVLVVGVLLVFWVLNSFINPGLSYSNNGMQNMNGYNMSGNNMNGYSMNGSNINGYNMNGSNMSGSNMNGTNGYGLNASLGFTSVFSLLIKVLSYVFVISLIFGIVVYLKKMYEIGNLNFIKSTVNQDVAQENKQEE